MFVSSYLKEDGVSAEHGRAANARGLGACLLYGEAYIPGHANYQMGGGPRSTRVITEGAQVLVAMVMS